MLRLATAELKDNGPVLLGLIRDTYQWVFAILTTARGSPLPLQRTTRLTSISRVRDGGSVSDEVMNGVRQREVALFVQKGAA